MYNHKTSFLTFWFYPIFKNKKQKTNKNKKSKLKCKGFYNTMFMSVPSVYFYNTMFMSVPSVYLRTNCIEMREICDTGIV
jgi:hypothetical protein